MSAVCQQRRVLMEIPAPQPKIAARMRRSYLEILGARFGPAPPSRGSRNTNTKRAHSLDLSFGGVGGERIESQCEKMDDHPTPLSKQQLVQLIRSLILVEQVHPILTVWLQPGRSLLQKGVSSPGGIQSFMSGVGPSSPEEQRVGCCVGALPHGVAIHQRFTAVGHGQPQRVERAVLRHPGCSQSGCAPALPPRAQQRTGTAQEV